MSHVLLLLLLMGHTKKTASDAEIHVKMGAQKLSAISVSMINEVNRGFMDDVSQHILSHMCLRNAL